MRELRRFVLISALAALLLVPFGLGASQAEGQSRAHVYLLRGLMNIFSLGMDDLAEKIKKHGVYATVHNHSEWQSLADTAAADYKAGREGPIILIGHSLGADAVMEMAQYLDRKGIPIALVVPFDGTQSFSTPKNVQRLVNITQRDYAYMRKGNGFKGSLYNMDVSSDQSIGHISIDKSPRLHAQVVGYVLAAVGNGHRMAAPATPGAPGKPTAVTHHTPDGAAKPDGETGSVPPKPAGTGNGALNDTGSTNSFAATGTPVIALPSAATIATPQPSATPAPASGSAKTTRASHSMPD